MRNLLITLRFDGRNYHGFQVQENAVTVCQTFQDGVERVFGERLAVKGCSRTDAGVHANRYYISMLTENAIPCERVPVALNANLPRDMVVTDCREVPEDFHARYSAIGKRYVYHILNTQHRDPFLQGLAFRYGYPIDCEMLTCESHDFVGTYDFSAFCASGSSVEDHVRTITHAEVRRERDMVIFTVCGDGFLYNMVRIMAGTLIDISRGVISHGSIPDIIRLRDRGQAGATAPACGLYLDEVFYPLSLMEKKNGKTYEF